MDIIRIKEKKKIWFLGHRDIRPGGFQVQQCEHDCVPSCGPRGTKGGRSSETDGTFPADWPRYPQQNRSYPGWWKVQVTSRCMLDRRKSLSAPKLVIPWPIEMENGFLRFHWTISTLKKNSQCLIFFMEVSWFTSYNVRGYRGWADKNRRYKLKAFHSGRSISGRGEESKAWRFKNAIYRSFVRFYDENNSQDSSWFSLEIHGCMYDKNITGNRIFFFCSYFSIQRIEKAKTYTSRLRTTRMDLNKTKRIARRTIFCCQRSFMDKLYDDEQVIYWIFLMSINRFELLLISCEWKMNVSWSGENYTSKWDESIRIWNKLQKIMEISERNA